MQPGNLRGLLVGPMVVGSAMPVLGKKGMSLEPTLSDPGVWSRHTCMRLESW